MSTMAVKGDPAGYRLAYETGMSAVESQATVTRVNASMVRAQLRTFALELASLLLEMVGVIVVVGDMVHG